MKRNEDDYMLSTGKTFYANGGIVGLSPRGGLFGGYDQQVWVKFTPAERREIAAHMIEQWKAWAEKDAG